MRLEKLEILGIDCWRISGYYVGGTKDEKKILKDLLLVFMGGADDDLLSMDSGSPSMIVAVRCKFYPFQLSLF